MKRWIHAATSTNSGTIIRMVDPQKTAGRGFGKNELFKVYHQTEDPHEALALAYALRQDQIYPKDIDANDDISNIVDSSVLNLSDSIIEQDFNDTDLGSGEPIVFSVRVNGKLIYRSGLKESQWGKMPSDFANTSTNEALTDVSVDNSQVAEYDKLFKQFWKKVKAIKHPQIVVEGDYDDMQSVTVSLRIPVVNSKKTCIVRIFEYPSTVADFNKATGRDYVELLSHDVVYLDNIIQTILNDYPDVLYILPKEDVPNGSSVTCYIHDDWYSTIYLYPEYSKKVVARKSDKKATSGNYFLVSKDEFDKFI